MDMLIKCVGSGSYRFWGNNSWHLSSLFIYPLTGSLAGKIRICLGLLMVTSVM